MPGRWGETPCAALVLCLACGIGCSRLFRVYEFAALLCAGAALAGAGLAALRRGRHRTSLAAALAALTLAGLSLGLSARDAIRDDDARALVRRNALHLGELVPFDGCVSEEVETSPLGSLVTLELRGFRLGDRWVACRGRGQLRIPEVDPASADRPPALGYGDRVRGWAEWDVPRNFQNPGSSDRAARLERQGIYLIGRVKSSRVLEVLPSDCRSPWKGAALDLRERFRRAVAAGCAAHEREAAILRSVVLGDYSGLDPQTRASFQNAGTYHVLVVSGLHVGWISWALLRFFRLLRFPGGPSRVLVACSVVAYSALVGFQASISRCLVMFSLALAGRALFRTVRLANVVLGSALLLLWAFPEWLFEIGFQLSYLSVLAVVLLGAPLVERGLRPRLEPLTHAGGDRLFLGQGRAERAGRGLRTRAELAAEAAAERWSGAEAAALRLARVAGRAALSLGAMLSISFAAQLWLGPVLAIYFNRLSWVSPLANLVAVPLSSLLLAAGVAAAAASAGLVPAQVAFALADRTSALLARSTELCAGLPAAWQRSATPHALWVAAGLLVVFSWCFLELKRLWLLSALLALLLTAIAFGWTSGASFPRLSATGSSTREPESSGLLGLVFLDVGQGDSIVIEFPDGRVWVFDGGGQPLPGPAEGSAQLDVGEAVVSRYLWARGIRALECVLLSHPHHDHAGGLAALMQNFPTGELDFGAPEGDPTMASLLAAARAGTVARRRVHSGDLRFRAGVTIETLNPGPDPGNRSINDGSVVLRLCYGRFTALLTGDLERAGELELVGTGAALRSFVLKVAHHGSRSATLEPFLDRVRPRWAVLSAGRNNPFGHPSREALLRLVHHGARPLLTLDQGAIAFWTDGRRYVVESHVSGILERGILPD